MAELATMKKFLGVIIALFICTNIMSVSAARLDIQNMDYEELMSLLSYQEEETDQQETNNIPVPPPSNPDGKRISSNLDFTITKPSASSILAPHVEILHIVESFLRLKGEMATRIHALINDNFDLFQSIYNVIVSKSAKLHSFTLMGISVIRKILEFAVQMIGTWELNAPSASIGVNKVFNILG